MSSIFSPTPTYLTGMPICWRMGTIDAALGRAVELGEDDPRAADRFGEAAGLAQAVLTGRRVEHEQAFVRPVGDFLGDDAANLGQFVHQVLLRLQPAGRVDDQHVALLGERPLAADVSHAGRVGAARLRDDAAAESLAPHA